MRKAGFSEADRLLHSGRRSRRRPSLHTVASAEIGLHPPAASSRLAPVSLEDLALSRQSIRASIAREQTDQSRLSSAGPPPPLDADAVTYSGFLWFLVAVASLSGLLFGYDTGVVSGAMILVRPAFGLDHVQHEAVVSAIICGCIVGSLSTDALSSALGRKPVILLSALVISAGSGVLAGAQSLAALIVGRLIVGLGIGAALSTVPVYIAELAPTEARGMMVGINNACVVLGQVAAALLCAAAASLPWGWRLMLGAAALPALLQCVGLGLLPESPRWLVERGRDDEALAALVRLRFGRAREAAAQRELGELRRARVASEAAAAADGGGTWRALLGVRRQLVLGGVLMFLQQAVGINTIMYYAASILLDAGLGSERQVLWLAVPVACAQAPGLLLAMHAIDRAGRRPLVLGSLGGVVASLLVEAASFLVADSPRCAAERAARAEAGACAAAGWLSLAGMVLYLLAFGLGMSAVPWLVVAEIFPARVRSRCVGIVTAVNWLTNLVVAATFLSLERAISRAGTFCLYAAVGAAGGAWLAVAMPETAQRDLDEIEALFAGREGGAAPASSGGRPARKV